MPKKEGKINDSVIENMLDLWDTRNHDPPPEEDSHISELVYDDSDSRIPQYDYRE